MKNYLQHVKLSPVNEEHRLIFNAIEVRLNSRLTDVFSISNALPEEEMMAKFIDLAVSFNDELDALCKIQTVSMQFPQKAKEFDFTLTYQVTGKSFKLVIHCSLGAIAKVVRI